MVRKANVDEKPKKQSTSSKAGLKFPAGRILRKIHKTTGGRVSPSSGVYVAAVLECLTNRLLRIAGERASHAHRNRIKPNDFQGAINNDEDLASLFAKKTLMQGGTRNPDPAPCTAEETAAVKAAKKKKTKKQHRDVTPAARGRSRSRSRSRSVSRSRSCSR